MMDGRIGGKVRAYRDKGRWRLARARARLREKGSPEPGPTSFPTPARFADWILRGPSARWSGFPLRWCAVEGLRPESPSKVAVVMHVYYPELVPELIDHLARIPVPFDLIITNSSGQPIAAPTHELPMMGHCLVLEIDNRGRDIYPLVALVNADILAPYSFVLKVHTKRSPWRAEHELDGTGGTWRESLLRHLLGGEDEIARLLASMVEQPGVGIVTAPGSVLGEVEWGDNEPIVEQLLLRLELALPRALTFPAGSMYWTRGFILQGLRGLNLTREDFEAESGQVNQTTAHAIERLVGILAREAGLEVLDATSIPEPKDPSAWRALGPDPAPAVPRARVVPFYLPQFHAVDENEAWWGPGFTEWTNVAAAKPVFPGHWQPKLPRDLGFYDLTDPEVLLRQEQMAGQAGLAGFMFYHYWFSGRRILEAPLLARIERDGGAPFCVMWANENWTRRWDGRSEDVLIAQDYADVPASEFLDSILPELSHPAYLKVGGRALLAVYRPAQIPDVRTVTRAWRERARSAGIGELYLVAVDVPGSFDGLSGSPQELGFDGLMGFAPHNIPWTWCDPGDFQLVNGFRGNVFSYGSLTEAAISRLRTGVPSTDFPGVMTGFDNTARRATTPDLWFGSNPFTFRRWLAEAVAAMSDRPADERIVFVNAWNEWAEGATLEPSDKFGLSYLQAVRDVLIV